MSATHSGPQRGRQKRALDEIKLAYESWLGGGGDEGGSSTTLERVLKEHLKISDGDQRKQAWDKLAPLRQPLNDAEKDLDEKLAQGHHVVEETLKDDIQRDFVRCREVFYLQRAQAMSIATELQGSGGDVSTFDLIANALPHVYLAPHRDALGLAQEKSETRSKKRRKAGKTSPASADNDENEAFSWFAKALEIPLLHRDYELAFIHLTKGKKLTVESLNEAYSMVGLPKPGIDELQAMVKDTVDGDSFEPLFEFIRHYT